MWWELLVNLGRATDSYRASVWMQMLAITVRIQVTDFQIFLIRLTH